ncbi:hypothetical protein MTP99_018623 [Tenebrio molitor]|nr:hypothetical protein MTP99_018623 [Tenebrio molitor]
MDLWDENLEAAGQRKELLEVIEETPLAHVITPPHPMVHSAVEVPDVDAIINTLRPHPVITSVEGRQWLFLPHTTIQIQGTPLLSLLDSGSEVTCINDEYFIALKARDTIHTLPVSTSRLVGAAGQQSSRIKWQALLDGATPASRPNSRGCTSPSSTRSQTTEEVWENWEDVFHAGDYVLLRESPISNAAKKVIAKFCPLYSGPYVIRECPYPNVYNSIRSPTRLQGKSKEYRSNREGTYGRPREAALMRMSAISTPQEICVDFYGLLQTGRLGASYVFVVIDTFSKFLKLYPLRKATAKVAAKRLIENYAGYIKPKCVLSDHGTQFLSSIWENSLRAADIQPTLSSIRHPESNPSERVMRELGLLPQRAPLSREEIHAKVRENLRHHANLRQRNQKGETTVLELDDWVLLKNKVTSDTRTQQFAKFMPLYRGPYKIIAKPHPNTYQIAEPVSNEIKGVYNMTNLKFYHRRDE